MALNSGKARFLVEVSPGETRIAKLDAEGRLREMVVERLGRESLIGAICTGRVVRIERGLGGAFVDIGTAQSGFLAKAEGLHEGASVIVQVTRDPFAEKGATLTRRISLAGRYLALVPKGKDVDWSRRLRGARARARLEPVIESLLRDGEGLAVRPPAANADRGCLERELERLRRLWQEIEARAASGSEPKIVLPPPGAIERLLRDRSEDAGIVIDDRRAFDLARRLAETAMPDLVGCLVFHERTEPLFEVSGVEDQIEQALERRVPLPGGGALTFDRTEALNVVDVDLGGAGGRRQPGDAVLAANLEAADEVARQIVLRNLSGLIVVDFVSMRHRGHRKRVVDAVRRALRDSASAVDVLGMTPAGLVEITRQRLGPELGDLMLEPIPPAARPHPEAEACAALRAALRTLGPGRPVLRARPEIVAALEGPLAPALAETARRLGQPLSLEPDPGHRGYEVVLRRGGS